MEKNFLYRDVADTILGLIRSGRMEEGEKLPSLRALSSQLGVSLNTVIEAYSWLEREHLVEAVPQSGYYVGRRPEPDDGLTDRDPQSLDPREVSLCRISAAFRQRGEMTPEIGLAVAALDPDLWPAEKLSRYMQAAFRDKPRESLDYCLSPGYRPLREQIALYGTASGTPLKPEDIIITSGCHEAAFLALQVLCRPGDTVAIESPAYYNFLQLFHEMDLKVLEIPCHQDEGVHLETLQFALEHHPVKVFVAITNFSNPTGTLMPDLRKKALLTLLETYGVPLVEDDIYGDLYFGGSRPRTCKSFDESGGVLLCSSFSKTLTPGLRVGWIAPGRWFERIAQMKTLMNIGTATPGQMAVSRFLQEGGYARHLRKVRSALSRQLGFLRNCVLEHFPRGTQVTEPRGGMVLWITMPSKYSSMALYHRAMENGISLAPGPLFSFARQYGNCFRLNGGTWNERVEKAVVRLSVLLREQDEN